MSKITDDERERKREAETVEALAEGRRNDVIRAIVEALSWPDRRGKMPRLWRHLFPAHGPGVPEAVVVAAVAAEIGLDPGVPGLRDVMLSCLGAMVARGELRVKGASLRQFAHRGRGRVEARVFLPGEAAKTPGGPRTAGWLSARQLAERFGEPVKVMEERLRRRRKADPLGTWFTESANRARGTPRFFYDPAKIEPLGRSGE